MFNSVFAALYFTTLSLMVLASYRVTGALVGGVRPSSAATPTDVLVDVGPQKRGKAFEQNESFKKSFTFCACLYLSAGSRGGQLEPITEVIG